jgi:hypothetical protein
MPHPEQATRPACCHSHTAHSNGSGSASGAVSVGQAPTAEACVRRSPSAGAPHRTQVAATGTGDSLTSATLTAPPLTDQANREVARVSGKPDAPEAGVRTASTWLTPSRFRSKETAEAAM